MRVFNGMAGRKGKTTADGYGRGHAAARGDAGDARMEHLIPPRVTKPWRRGEGTCWRRGRSLGGLREAISHCGRIKISRVSQASPSAKNRALGEVNLPRVLYSGKNYTRRRETFSSATKYLALGEEQHSVKALFLECNTRKRATLGEEKCYLTA